ncbi:hypothetical protein CVIRNUC_007045 [Coccomyxa viridis]|uniref:MRG domain-containing protein n=1 Tax=Coccomyxa viridis TaxID=1274662 RepID=A0AAV1ICV2_9CHLO|nr:hypothetical protein CVIRNUC_007045 [Coccomyxa viridis]
MPRDRGPFRNGERVLVPHTDKYYEAKILKTERRDDMWYYLIHYAGWNKQWDEWVEQTGLHKYKKELLDVKFEETSAQGTGDAKSGGDAGATSKKGDSKKRKSTGISGPMSSKVRVQLPALLKQKLVEDWQRAERGNELALPRKPSISDILQQYVDSTRGTRDSVEAEEEIANGLRIYFDKALQQLLLYATEQDLAAKALSDGTTPSSIYGGEHLLRLCYKLPEILPVSSMSADDQLQLEMRLASLVSFLKKNEGLFFTLPAVEAKN